MARRPARRRSRKRPPRKPLESFLDNLTEVLLDLAGTAIFGGTAVLVGRALGSRAQPRVELPPGLPPEVVAEWEKILAQGAPARGGTSKSGRASRAPEREAEVVDSEPCPPRPQRKPVRLVKGDDGIYRPYPG